VSASLVKALSPSPDANVKPTYAKSTSFNDPDTVRKEQTFNLMVITAMHGQ
jgi:hypothetical protein